MTQATRIYKHSAAGTDWAALMLGAGLGLTLALQATTLRAGDFRDFYSVVVTVSRLAALVGTYLSVVGIFLVARIPVVERGVGHDRLVTWHRKLGPWSLYLIGAHVFLIMLGFAGQDQIPLVINNISRSAYLSIASDTSLRCVPAFELEQRH